MTTMKTDQKKDIKKSNIRIALFIVVVAIALAILPAFYMM